MVQDVLFKEQRVVLEMDYLVMYRVLDPVQARFLAHHQTGMASCICCFNVSHTCGADGVPA